MVWWSVAAGNGAMSDTALVVATAAATSTSTTAPAATTTATPAAAVCIGGRHFEAALQRVRPSVTPQDRLRYAP
jgi:hypothetical protein